MTKIAPSAGDIYQTTLQLSAIWPLGTEEQMTSVGGKIDNGTCGSFI